MATNLLTLALGSALIDLALIAIAASTQDSTGRTVWRFAVPGVASTLTLTASVLLMDVQVGHASLFTRDLPTQVLILLSAAGILRLLVFPFHPRELNTPEAAATLLLPVGAGSYLLARVQATTPILADQAWVAVMGGVALLAGGFLAWLRNMDAETERGPDWPAFAVHQTGYVLVFAILLGPSLPWPLISLSLSLGILAIWWDMNLEPEANQPGRWLQWIGQRLEPWWEQAQSFVAKRIPALERWRNSWIVQRGTALVPLAALASLVGAPFTAGAVGRWSLYATLLHNREATLLITTLAADTVLSAGLWLVLGIVLKQASDRRPKGMALVAMAPLVTALIALGTAPNKLMGSSGFKPLAPPDVSAWGLGFIFVFPWLVGGWLARVGSRVGDLSMPAQRAIDLGWLYRAATWLGQRLAGAVGWLGQIGEGDGWWGWALIILAIGAMFLLAR